MKKKKNQLIFSTTLLICLFFAEILLYIHHKNIIKIPTVALVKSTPFITTPPKTNIPTSLPQNVPTKIYSFFQGPKALEKGLEWSGNWANEYYDGNKFGSFGCGLCCMANLYCTLSEYECSPVDMYNYAKEVSNYQPSYGYGAIDWNAMATTLNCCGFSTDTKNKPDNYSDFQSDIENSIGTVVLVSSRDSDEYWQQTPGHYVTIWNYDKENDTVFLTDSGNISHNRDTVPLLTIFNSLKTSAEHQYLVCQNYNNSQNLWKWNQISEEWNRP